MSIIAHPATPTPPRTLHLTIVFAELDGLVARLDGRVLTLDTDSSPEDQVWAAGDAVAALLTGSSSFGRRPRHLRAV